MKPLVDCVLNEVQVLTDHTGNPRQIMERIRTLHSRAYSYDYRSKNRRSLLLDIAAECVAAVAALDAPAAGGGR